MAGADGARRPTTCAGVRRRRGASQRRCTTARSLERARTLGTSSWPSSGRGCRCAGSPERVASTAASHSCRGLPTHFDSVGHIAVDQVTYSLGSLPVGRKGDVHGASECQAGAASGRAGCAPARSRIDSLLCSLMVGPDWGTDDGEVVQFWGTKCRA